MSGLSFVPSFSEHRWLPRIFSSLDCEYSVLSTRPASIARNSQGSRGITTVCLVYTGVQDFDVAAAVRQAIGDDNMDGVQPTKQLADLEKLLDRTSLITHVFDLAGKHINLHVQNPSLSLNWAWVTRGWGARGGGSSGQCRTSLNHKMAGPIPTKKKKKEVLPINGYTHNQHWHSI